MICQIRGENCQCDISTGNAWSQKVKQRDYKGQIKYDTENLLTNRIQFSEAKGLKTVKYSETET